MILSAHQPAYLPWLGYWAKIAMSDTFVIHDLSPIGRGNMLNRNRIGTADGPLLLTVPLDHRDLRAALPLNQIRLADDRWRGRHWRAIQAAYRRAPYFDDHADFLGDYFLGSYATLDQLCRPFIEYCTAVLELNTKVWWMSDLGIADFDRNSIIPLLSDRFEADEFVIGPHAVDYLDIERVAQSGVRLRAFEYVHPTYRQPRIGFTSHLSVLDLLMNCGPDSSRVIREGLR